ncbi:MAG: type IV pilin [archaeon]|nr:MAG: type IV pilin [archaeon]
MKKKAVAPVISTVLLIVIVIVAVALIMAFVIPMIRENMDKAKACGAEAQLDLEYANQNITTNNVTIRVTRSSAEYDLRGIVVQLISVEGTEVKEIDVEGFDPFESRVIEILWRENITSVGIAPVVKLVGKEKVIKCDIQTAIPVNRV